MDFKTFTLKNGAKIKYLYRDSIPIVYLSVLIPASPLDEIKPSVAYLTAHLLTHGTKTRTVTEIEDEIDFFAISIDKKNHPRLYNAYPCNNKETSERSFKPIL